MVSVDVKHHVYFLHAGKQRRERSLNNNEANETVITRPGDEMIHPSFVISNGELPVDELMLNVLRCHLTY